MHTVLVDTSVWVDHFRKGEALLQDLLSSGQVATHPFIIGELACGHLSNRTEILKLLSELPLVAIASNEEVMHMIEKQKLAGKGLGWIDVHLLASSLLDHIPLWTRDRQLAAAARTLGIAGAK
jgi:predicted nucleic acid-binding protein